MTGFEYDFGDLIEDTVTGFKGIVMARTEYSSNIIVYGLLSRELNKGLPKDAVYMESSRLRLVTELDEELAKKLDKEITEKLTKELNKKLSRKGGFA